jgi:hypothetical protein
VTSPVGVPEDMMADTSSWLAELRSQFPGTGIVFTGRQWIAVRGKSWVASARNPTELYDRLIAERLSHRKAPAGTGRAPTPESPHGRTPHPTDRHELFTPSPGSARHAAPHP